ncbi:gamma-glutamylcyclotransferase [Sediminibacillus albus]|uniref:Uncharacterized conserved protein YtfP, gamma-glutamylcyclotransferase (GGCT)/AIG2-like family n=1 Tax=Sediminibacillus albus TaxID=407036 RepID=A0A1G8VT45_9BACI|nr:gamma-glutamylcyclotransferase family protein [Sediminibacillus albus]SDJ69271.1 Uncharacterized conserved protein YtfP, gamma-glutamylcyclotransferase (GGCT)/AIG2-like family [Sediminibacillus albus]
MSTNHLIFVYGTLMEHEPNHHLLKDAKCVARHGWTSGALYDTRKGYPVLSLDSSQRVYGEVYEISEEDLQEIDKLEGFQDKKKDNGFTRTVQTIQSDFGIFQANVYVNESFQLESLKRVAFGDWKAHRYLDRDSFLYFAYGSCMDTERFSSSGVDQLFKQVAGCGIAENFSLAYTRAAEDGGRADIVESTGTVEGKVYQLNKQALEYLFVREGVAGNHYRPAFVDVIIDGVLHKHVLTFLVIDKSQEIAPPIHYATEILRGASGFVSDHYYSQLEHDLLNKFQLSIPINSFK